MSLFTKLFDAFKRKRMENVYNRLAYKGKGIHIAYPFHGNPAHVYVGDYSTILNHAELISAIGHFHVGRYTEISTHLTVVTENHTPTVGIPYSFTGTLHINDKAKDVIIEDDCWLGTNVTLLPGTKIGRGSVVGACTLCNKNTPPYAVLVGIPARIVGVKFSLEEILEHERCLYCPEERLSREELERLFEENYRNKKVLGTSYISEEDLQRVTELMHSKGFQPYTNIRNK